MLTEQQHKDLNSITEDILSLNKQIAERVEQEDTELLHAVHYNLSRATAYVQLALMHSNNSRRSHD